MKLKIKLLFYLLNIGALTGCSTALQSPGALSPHSSDSLSVPGKIEAPRATKYKRHHDDLLIYVFEPRPVVDVNISSFQSAFPTTSSKVKYPDLDFVSLYFAGQMENPVHLIGRQTEVSSYAFDTGIRAQTIKSVVAISANKFRVTTIFRALPKDELSAAGILVEQRFFLEYDFDKKKCTVVPEKEALQ